jgi:hypothetical protein
MHNMHAGLSQVLAVHLMAPRWEAAAQGRVVRVRQRRRTPPAGNAGLVAAGWASSERLGGDHTEQGRAGRPRRLVFFLAGCGHTGGHGWRVHEPSVHRSGRRAEPT